MLRAALSSSDPFFHSCLYDALIDMGEVSTLLSSGAPHLEAYLVANSGCGGALQAAAAAGMLHGSEGALLAMPPVGPLTAQQLNLANLLAKLYIGQQRFREAAILYTALGMRASGAGERAVTLGQRVKSLQLAVLQAKSAGDAGLAEKLEADARLMGYQADVASRLSSAAAAAAQGSAEASQLSRMASDLASGLRDVSEMYNDYTQPQRMWDICLQLVDFAGGVVDSTLVRNLWDHTLLAAWEGTLQGSQPGSGRPASGVPQSLAQLSEVLPVVERLGSQFYPSESR
jgi:nuclear pore complex protein Nup155